MFSDAFEENIPGETASSVNETVHSAQEDNKNYRPFNYFSRQIELIKGIENTTVETNYFHKLKIKIIYREMTESFTKKSAIYFHNDSDFLTFQKAYVEIINANHLTK